MLPSRYDSFKRILHYMCGQTRKRKKTCVRPSQLLTHQASGSQCRKNFFFLKNNLISQKEPHFSLAFTNKIIWKPGFLKIFLILYIYSKYEYFSFSITNNFSIHFRIFLVCYFSRFNIYFQLPLIQVT